MQGSWEQSETQNKSWGMDCSGKIQLTRTVSLDQIDEDKGTLMGTYTREANGRLDTSSTIARALRAGPDGQPETCVFDEYNESTFFETRTYNLTITCSEYGGCRFQGEETDCSGTCISHDRSIWGFVDGGSGSLSLNDWHFSRR